MIALYRLSKKKTPRTQIELTHMAMFTILVHQAHVWGSEVIPDRMGDYKHVAGRVKTAISDYMEVYERDMHKKADEELDFDKFWDFSEDISTIIKCYLYNPQETLGAVREIVERANKALSE